MPSLVHSVLLLSGLLVETLGAPAVDAGHALEPTKVDISQLFPRAVADAPPVATTRCNPGAEVRPTFPNANFSRSVRNPNFNIDQPTNWTADAYDNIRSVTLPNGNKVVQINATGTYAQIDNTPLYFEPDPCSKNRYYNVTFDAAVPSYKLADPKVFGNCTLDLSTTADWIYRKPLANFTVGTTLQRQGPYLFDSNPVPRYGIHIRVQLSCSGNISPKDKVAIWADNFQFTQYGKNVTVDTSAY